MTDSYIFNKMFRTLTDLKFEASFLSHHYLDCFSNGKQMQFSHCQEKLL